VACALMLPAALQFNRPNCEAEMSDLARIVWPRDAFPSATAAADALVARIGELCQAVGVPRRLRDINVSREQLPVIVESAHGNSLDGNPITVADDQLHAVLERMW